jgi:hypothetical protein
MKRRRFDRVQLDASKARRRESDGALIVPGRFARTGCQTYQNADGSDRIEYRSREEVLASAPTFEGVAITDLHPADFVGPSNWQELARGHMQGIRSVDGEDEETWLEGDIVIGAGSLADSVEQGRRSELSAGYTCDYIEGEIEYRGELAHGSQSGIIGNHVAALAKGDARAGRGARMMLDSNGNQITPAPPPGEEKGNERMATIIRSRGVDYEVEGPGAEGLKQSLEEARKEAEGAEEEEKAKAAEELEESKADAAKARAEADSAQQEVKRLTAELAKERDPERRAKDAAELQELADKAKVVAGKAIDSTGTPHEIRLAALKAGGEDVLATIPEDRKADSVYIEAYTSARFDAAHAHRRSARASVTEHRGDANPRGDIIIESLKRRDAEREARSRQLRGLPRLERS